MVFQLALSMVLVCILSSVVLSRQILDGRQPHNRIALSRTWGSRQTKQTFQQRSRPRSEPSVPKLVDQLKSSVTSSVSVATIMALPPTNVERRVFSISGCVVPTISVGGPALPIVGIVRTVTAMESVASATGLPSVAADRDDLDQAYFFDGSSSNTYTPLSSVNKCNSPPTGHYGNCTIPQIEFGVGFDGRLGTSFRPVDLVSYNCPSSTNIDDIATFLCQGIISICGGDPIAEAMCYKAKGAATGSGNSASTTAPSFSSFSSSSRSSFSLTASATTAHTHGKGFDTGAQADAFNSVMGFITGFSNVAPKDDRGLPLVATISQFFSSSTSSSVSPSTTLTSSDLVTMSSVTSLSETLASSTSIETPTSSSFSTVIINTSPQIATKTTVRTVSSAAKITSSSTFQPAPTAQTPSNDNLQTFSGALGGISPPPVTASGNAFFVEGNSFTNMKDAIGRSCDIQNNDCADAANASGNRSFTVAQCSQQRATCAGG